MKHDEFRMKNDEFCRQVRNASALDIVIEKGSIGKEMFFVVTGEAEVLGRFVFQMMGFAFKIMDFVLKMMDSALNMMGFGLTMMDFALNMMDCLLTMMDFVLQMMNWKVLDDLVGQFYTSNERFFIGK